MLQTEYCFKAIRVKELKSYSNLFIWGIRDIRWIGSENGRGLKAYLHYHVDSLVYPVRNYL